MNKVSRLDATLRAKALVKELSEEFGDLMFYQSGGCCEGTQPMCFKKGSYYPRLNDVCIGQIEGFDFWIDRDLFEYWKYAHFTLDVVDGFGTGGFSLEIPKGVTFKVIYELFTDEELAQLDDVKLHKRT